MQLFYMKWSKKHHFPGGRNKTVKALEEVGQGAAVLIFWQKKILEGSRVCDI